MIGKSPAANGKARMPRKPRARLGPHGEKRPKSRGHPPADLSFLATEKRTGVYMREYRVNRNLFCIFGLKPLLDIGPKKQL